MSDHTPREGGTESGEEPGENSHSELPPENLPQELLQQRLSRMDTRQGIAELCKSVPGLEEILLPRGIQADALTRKTGGRANILKPMSQRIMQDVSAWSAFKSAISPQIPQETAGAAEELSPDNADELANAHSTEELLLAALNSEEASPEAIQGLIEAWNSEHEQARRDESENARIKELQEEVENLRQENSRLSSVSQTEENNADTLRRERDNLRADRDEASSRAKRAEEQAAEALDVRESLRERIQELEGQVSHLQQALESERSNYESATARLDELHEELNRTISERDRVSDYLNQARFTEQGFGELLVRAVKNEVGALPDSTEQMARSARLLESMGRVIQTHAELREPHGGTTEEDEEDEPSSPELPPEEGGTSVLRPTVSFRVLGGASGVGGSSHLLDLGRTRLLVDAGVNLNARGPVAPDFSQAGRLDAAVITHAHLDHCGALPLLCRQRPELPIYCTPPSEKLILSALNEHSAMSGGLSGGASLQEVRRRLIPLPFGRPLNLGDTSVTFTESGHILGAASVFINSEAASVFHTGDICLEEHFSIPSARLPEVEGIDLLIMEATLADREPQPFLESVRRMVEVINETVLESGGSVLIPTYALGQAQEIMLALKHYSQDFGLDPNVLIYADGSVVTTSERLYAEQLAYMKPYLQNSDPREVFFSDNVRAVSNDDGARERILQNPCAIIASPVTMEGGASGFYRNSLKDDPRNALVLPSNAEATYNAEEERWRIERVGFAAHCTQEDLFRITDTLDPRQVILIHGSKRRMSDLAYRLSSQRKIHTPAVGETVRTVVG